MGVELIVENFTRAAMLAFILSGVPLSVGLVVGLFVSVLQAATQIQEQTLTFVPKLVAICAVLFLFGKMLTSVLIDYAREILFALPQVF